MTLAHRQKMHQWISISAATLCLIMMSAPSLANSATDSYTDYAEVTNVSPMYATVAIRRPHRECHTEERVVRNHRNHSYTPNILGALMGGAIGNELGHNKSNKRVGAVAGAILGGSIASDMKRSNRHQGHYTKTEQVCSTSHSVRHKSELAGYDVSYQYHGRRYSTIMDSHPGNSIRIAVDVSPIDY